MLWQILAHLLQGEVFIKLVIRLFACFFRFVFRPVEESSYFFFSQLWVKPSFPEKPDYAFDHCRCEQHQRINNLN